MSLGVLTNIGAIYAENNLNQTSASLQKTLTQLSSGSRINSGADDAAGLSVVNGLQANVTALTQSAQNASDGIGLLQTADGALSQVTNLLNRAVTLATEAANGTLNTNQVSSANAEYQNILQEIGNIGSTTNFNGNSVFTSTAKTVFVSDGTASGANSYSEVVGNLNQGSVGQTVGATTLGLPTPTTPTATTTVQQAVTIGTPTASLVNPTPVAASATASASSTITPVVTGSTAFSGTQIIANTGVQAASGGAAYTPSTVTGAAGAAFTGTDTYGGTLGVRLVTGNGASQLYSATVAPGSSLQSLVTGLNNSFGYVPNSGTASTSGLQASVVNNALQITTSSGTVGQVSVDAPSSSLKATISATAYNVSFGSTGGVTATTATAGSVATATAASSVVSLGTGEVQGNLIISSSAGTALGTVAFGSGASATDGTNGVQAALATAFGASGVTSGSTVSYSGTNASGLSGYSASLNTTTGALTVTGNAATGANFQLTTAASGTGVLSAGTNGTPVSSGLTAGAAALTTSLVGASTPASGVTITLGTTGVSGNLVIGSQALASVGTISFGTGSGTAGIAGIQSTLASQFGTAGAAGATVTYTGTGTFAGYTATLTTATGALNVNNGATTGASISTDATTLQVAATPTAVSATNLGAGTITSAANTSTTGAYTGSTITLGAATATTSDSYSGTLTLQLANSAQTYTASIAAGSSGLATVNAINAALGSSITNAGGTTGTAGTSGLVAVLTANGAVQINTSTGAGQAVVDNSSNFVVNPGGNTGAATGVTVTGGTATTTGYTATQTGTASSPATSTVSLGTAAVAGSLSIYSGTTGQGTALGAINFGVSSGAGSVGGTGTGAGSVQAAIASTFTGAVTSNSTLNTVTYSGGSSGSLSGYSATYNTGTGALTINGPANGNSFSLGQATSGSSELQTGTVSTTLEAGTGVTASTAVYSGTINFGSNNTSYAISTPQTAAQLTTGTIANNTFLADVAAAGLAVTNNGGQLQFTNTSVAATAPPAVTVTGGASANEVYTASSVSFNPTSGSGSSATFSGSFSIAQGGTNYTTTLSNTTGNQALVLLNGQTPGTGILGNSGLVASLNGTTGNLVVTGTAPTSPSGVAAAQISVNSSDNLSGLTASTQTLTNSNAASGTTYTGTISFGAVGTTAAGSYVVGSNGAGTTATAIAAALNASSVLGGASSGITASVNSSNELVFNGPSTGSAVTQGPGVTLTNVTATAPSVTSYSASTANFAANTGGTFAGTLTVGTSGTGQISTTVAAGTTLNNLVTQLNNQYTQAGVSSQLSASAGTGSQAGQLIISSATPTTAAQATSDQLIFSQANGANTLQATSATSTNGGPGAGVNFTSAGLNQLTSGTAQQVLTAVTSAINDVAYQRGLIGANVNELTAASNVASAESVNLTSAQASIQSTDYGATTSNLAKYQVLSQTGISALAQANSVQQEVLKLLQ
jgi:flagellin